MHGVNVREDDRYRESQKVRDNLFRTFALDDVVTDPQNAAIENPYWGKFGAHFYWNNASLLSWGHRRSAREKALRISSVIPVGGSKPRRFTVPNWTRLDCERCARPVSPSPVP